MVEGTPPNSVRFRKSFDEEYHLADRQKQKANDLQGASQSSAGIAAPHEPAPVAAASDFSDPDSDGTYWHPALRPSSLKFESRAVRDAVMSTTVEGTPPNTLRFSRYEGEPFYRADRLALNANAPGSSNAAAASSSTAAVVGDEPSIEEQEYHLRQARAAVRESHGYSDSEFEESSEDFVWNNQNTSESD